MAQGGFNGPGRYEIYSPLSRKVIDMDRNDRTTVIQFESRRTDNQTWDFSDAGGGYYFIRNAMNGNALAVRDDRNSSPLIAEPFSSSERQMWRVENGDRNTVILVSRNGKAIDIPFGSTNASTKINSYNRSGEENQRWELRVAGASGGFRSNSSTVDPGRRESRYDAAPLAGSARSDTNGMYLDDREQVYKIDGDGVCFYADRDFRGEAVCARVRAERGRLGQRFTSFGSVRFFGNARAIQLFDKEDFRGNAVELERDERDLRLGSGNYGFRGVPRSMRVY